VAVFFRGEEEEDAMVGGKRQWLSVLVSRSNEDAKNCGFLGKMEARVTRF
jgi:hypothetical protein